MKRKGISPLIAAVLLIAFTLAVAALLTAWVTTFTQQTTEQVGNESQRVIECSYAGVSIFSAVYDGGADELTVQVANTGTSSLNQIAVTVSLANGTVYNQNIDPAPATGQVESVTFSGLGSRNNIDSVRIASVRCPEITDRTSQIS